MGSIANYLIENYGWYEGIAKALEESGGECAYCEEQLLKSRPAYSCIVMDHLLPRKIFEEYRWDTRNHVLSCSSCNSMKGNWNPLREGEDPSDKLEHARDELIGRVREHLQSKIESRKLEWQDIKSKIINGN